MSIASGATVGDGAGEAVGLGEGVGRSVADRVGLGDGDGDGDAVVPDEPPPQPTTTRARMTTPTRIETLTTTHGNEPARQAIPTVGQGPVSGPDRFHRRIREDPLAPRVYNRGH